MKWLLLLLLLGSSVHARQIEGVDFPEELTLAAKKLVLNGVGLRTKRKLGMNFKVYVAGLYTLAKNRDARTLINSSDPKVLELVFLRSLDKETLEEAWKDGFNDNCKADCEVARAQIKAFTEVMVDVKEKSRIKITFEGDVVNVDVDGKKEKKNTKIEGPAIRRSIMAIFIGDKPPTEELKTGLLGG